MTTLLAWIWAPLLLYVLVLGLGLLADSLLRADLPPAVIPPLGLALAITIVTPGYRLGVGAPLAIALIGVAAVAGFVLARRQLRDRLWAPPALAGGLAVYALYMAPVLLSGDPTWAGYNFVNDTASNFNLVNLLEHKGATAPTDETGTAENLKYLVGSGYPLGSFSVVATLRPLIGAPVEAIYQPVLSTFAALAAMSLVEIGRRSGLAARSAVGAAVLALGGVLLYRYTLHGAIKEIALVALCATVAALGSVALDRRLAVRYVVPVAVVCLSMVLVFSAAAGAFAVAAGAAMLVAAMFSPHRPTLRHIGRLIVVSAGVALLVLLPTLGSTLDFASTIREVFAASGENTTGTFGQLLRPLPLGEVAGVWISDDYRLPAKSPLGINPVLLGASALAAVAGLAFCLVHNRPAPLLLLATVGLPALALSPISSPYIDGKLLALLTPAVVFLAAFACFAAAGAARRSVRVGGFVALAVVGLGVLASDLYTYRETRLAPTDRVAAMEDVASRVPDRGLYLLNEWEEFGKYFMRSARVNPASEAESLRPVTLRRPVPIFGQWFDLDLQTLPYVDGFSGIIMRRSPVASRPPANFRMTYRNDYYELWRRQRRINVLAHLPLQRLDQPAGVPRCRQVRAFARSARASDRLVAARRPPVVALSPFKARRPAVWHPSPDLRGTVVPTGPGSMVGTLDAGGLRRVWLKVTGGRPFTVFVDGREVGKVQQVNTPDQWLEVGTASLAPGRHRVEVRRHGAGPAPGDAYNGLVGPLALEGVIPRRRLISVSPRDASSLCGHRWDWIELVGRR